MRVPMKWAPGVLLLVGVLLFGCADDAEKKARYWKEAQAYLEKGELDKAVIELKNVVKIDAWDDKAYFQLGEIYMAKNDLGEAYQAFQAAVTTNEGNLDARLKIGRILLLAQRARDAREQAREVLKREPFHMGASMLLARIFLQEGDLTSAKESLERAIPWHPNHVPAWLLLGDLQLKRRDLEEADRAFLHAVYLDESLKPLVVGEGDYKTAPVLARHYERTRAWGQAEAMYEKVMEVLPGGRIPAMMEYAGFFARRGLYERALEVMESAAEEREDDLDILVQMAKLHMDFGRLGQAEETADQVLNLYKDHLGARLIKGRLLLEKKDYDGALNHLEAVVRETPGRAAAHYFQGMALMGKGELKQAQAALIRSLERDPGLLGARLLLAKIYLRRFERGHVFLAREQLERVLEAVPDHPEALILYGNLHLRENNLAGAETVFRKVLERRPEDPLAHARLATVYHLMGRNEEAAKLLEEALVLDPENLNMIGFLVDLYIRTGALDKALALCQDKRPAQGTDGEQAIFEQLLGKVFLAKGALDQAEVHFKQAVALDPGLLPAHRALTELYTRNGRTEELMAHYQEALRADPEFLPGHMILGLIHDEQGAKEAAVEHYRKALEIRRDFGPAANNLAVILADRGEELDEALKLALVAREQMPEDPYVMDTLGWVYHLLGHTWKALPELERAVRQVPENHVFHYHLGVASYAVQDLEKARVHLSKALEMDSGFEGAEEARRLIQEIEEAEKKEGGVE